MKTDIYDTDFKSHPKARGASATAVPATSCKMCVLVKKDRYKDEDEDEDGAGVGGLDGWLMQLK